jgi:hypothetical protein
MYGGNDQGGRDVCDSETTIDASKTQYVGASRAGVDITSLKVWKT